ncbi:MAG: class I SAM-dependent methyltransferase [Candidatus Aenigmatarchaeota archaeon]
MLEKLISAKGYWTAQEAEDYDRSPSMRKIQEGMTKSLLRHIGSRGAVLDIGCGTGFSMELLGKEAFGIDVSYEMLKLARRKGFSRLVLADARQLPFKDGAFERLLSISALQWLTGRSPEEVREQYAAALAEMARVLAHGGMAGLQFYPATEKEWELARREAASLFEGKIIEEGEGKKAKKYMILKRLI